MTSRKKSRQGRKSPATGCHIPPPPNKHILESYILSDLPDASAIRSYVEREARGETVEHLERLKVEKVFDRTYECWDVHTDRDRFWVITSPTNLYSQKHFPSLDYTLSFHIGVIARVLARQGAAPDGAQRNRLAAVWRRWEEAEDACHSAEEAEEFQSIGMRCRECLIQLMRSIADESMLPASIAVPKRSDVLGWSEYVANAIAPGASSEPVRSHLKSVLKSAWQLSNWLTHKSSATRHDASIALDATHFAATSLGSAAMRHESGMPERCPRCGSYALGAGFNPELHPTYVVACEKCGWGTEGSEELLSQEESDAFNQRTKRG